MVIILHPSRLISIAIFNTQAGPDGVHYSVPLARDTMSSRDRARAAGIASYASVFSDEVSDNVEWS